jgi:hypothetical protein
MLVPVPVSGSTKSVINVRILDALRGNPRKSTNAMLITWDANGHMKVLASGKTNSEGMISFQVTEKLPDQVGLFFFPDELENCSEHAYSSETILANGLVGGNSCIDNAKKPTARAQAGELSVFVRKITLWEKIRRELP